MTEPDKALLWARLAADHPVLGPAYRAGAAASEARIKELEDEVRELKKALIATAMQATVRQIYTTNEIKFSAPIRAQMKDPDQ